MREAVNKVLSSNDDALEKAVAGLSGVVQQEITKRRIYCLTKHPDSILMWSHYADNHRGVCLEFNTANPLFSTAKAVRYLKPYPSWLPMDTDHVMETVYTKSDAWKYEDEYRLLGIRTASGFPVQLDNDWLALPNGALKSVIIGCEADYEKIARFFKVYAPTLPLKRAVRANNQYRLAVAA